MRHIICIGGVPGTGKTTLVRSILKSTGTWQEVRPTRLLHAKFHSSFNTYILGKYQEDETFAGTDKLSMAVQPEVVPWIRSHTDHIIFEGDRLFTMSLLNALLTLPDTNVHIIVLEASKTCLEKRYTQRGSNQSEKFLKGRHTKIQKICNDPVIQQYLQVFKSDDETWLDHLTHHITQYIKES